MKKQKIITYLLIVSFTLLLLNVAIDIFAKQNTGEPEPTELTTHEIKERFEDVVYEFGIEKNWIKRTKLKERLSDSVSSVYEIRVPQELPVAVLLNELNRTFLKDNLTITSKEVTKGKTTTLKIFTNKILMLQADLIPDVSLIRQTAKLGFIIDDFDNLSESEMESLLGLPESFALTLLPSEKAEMLKKKITASGKEYVIVLNDDIDEVRFKLSQEYNERRLKGSIRNILGSFGDSRLFIIDEKSDLYSSPVLKIVNKDFTSRNLKLVLKQSFISVKGNDTQDLQSIFRYYCESSSSSGNKVFLITADDFIELKSVLEAYRKKGYKFVFPSSLNFGLQ